MQVHKRVFTKHSHSCWKHFLSDDSKIRLLVWPPTPSTLCLWSMLKGRSYKKVLAFWLAIVLQTRGSKRLAMRPDLLRPTRPDILWAILIVQMNYLIQILLKRHTYFFYNRKQAHLNHFFPKLLVNFAIFPTIHSQLVCDVCVVVSLDFELLKNRRRQKW